MPTEPRPQPSSPHIAAAILAGGKASRLGGRVKGFIQLGDGRTIIERLIGEVRGAGVSDVIICANEQESYRNLGLPIIADRRPDAGPLAGIEAVLYQMADSADGLLVLASDLARVEAGHLARLLSVAADHPGRLVSAVRAGEDDGPAPASSRGPCRSRTNRGRNACRSCRIEPLIAVIPTALRAVLTDFLDGGGRRVRAFYAEHDPLLVPLPPEAFTNINTPEDLAALLHKQEKSGPPNGPDRF